MTGQAKQERRIAIPTDIRLNEFIWHLHKSLQKENLILVYITQIAWTWAAMVMVTVIATKLQNLSTILSY